MFSIMGEDLNTQIQQQNNILLSSFFVIITLGFLNASSHLNNIVANDA